jgi:UDP-N-acetylmuramyl pentapeptide phosphotransferase/UDP-N-acetylglucosamine-1-phosphate transferase
MAINLAACVTAFLIAFITLPVIIKFFFDKNLVDVPGRRKIHKKITPSMGGIAIFIAFVIPTLIWMDFDHWKTTRFVLASLFIVFILGVRDDIVPFRALHKLYVQIIAVIILLFSGVKIGSFYGLFGIVEIPEIIAYVLTGFIVILITNSFNLIDGLDGLAGSIGLAILTSFGLWFHFADEAIFSLLCFAMVGGIVAFLVFNWEPSEIFMGDTGAMVIGMLLSVLVIHFMNINDGLPMGHPVKYKATIATGVCFIIIPLADTLRIIILRTLRGQSPFSPDKSHIHHAIMRLGTSHSRTALILASVNLLFIFGAWIFRDFEDALLVPGVIVLAVIFSLILDRLIVRKLSVKR